ncbi:MAG: MBL fold metallo-hydrolase [Verrucomicrobiales bacterium]|nr:MBL fold metallo-hydrolase [Verrucomicrobiales bacterium]
MKPKSSAISCRIKIHTIDLNFQNVPEAIASFLIETPKGLILVETGPESCRENLLEGMRTLGFSHDEVEGVFVTHIHLDHAGGAGWWAEQGKQVFVHPKGARHLIDPSRLEESARMIYKDRFDTLWGALRPAPEDKVTTVEDNETVSVAGLDIRALETPGHAFHHHAFAIGDVVLTGDSAGARLPGFDYISVTSAPPQFDLEHTLASIDRLASESFRELYLTHFGKIENAAEHLSDYRNAVELNAEFVRARLAEGMDSESLHVAYEAFNLEQAFRLQVPHHDWGRYQTVNGTAMCADGIRLYWEKKQS